MSLIELDELLNRLSLNSESSNMNTVNDSLHEAQNNSAGIIDHESMTLAENHSKNNQDRIASAESNTAAYSKHDNLVIKLRFSAASDNSSIAITTNSLYDIIKIGASAVDVPQEHIDEGLTTQQSYGGLAREHIHIKRAKEKPLNSLVSTKLHGWWYYIDIADFKSKTYFHLISALYESEIASAGKSPTPILTVPISR
jgi:hypothetical protein